MLLLMVADKGISLMNVGQWCHHENAGSNSVMNVIEPHEKFHHTVLVSLLIMFFYLVACEWIFICIKLIPKIFKLDEISGNCSCAL